MKSNKVTVATAIAALSVGIFACSRSAPVSYAPAATEPQAQSHLESRVQKTQRVRKQLGFLHDSLAPLDGVMKDLGKEMDSRMGQQSGDHPGSALASVLDRLQLVLGVSLDGIVETNPDGSWTIERQSPVCPAGVVSVSGSSATDTEIITVAHSDCVDPSKVATWATLSVNADGVRDVKIGAPAFSNLHGPMTFRADPCTLTFDPSGSASLSCQPLGFVAGQDLVLINSLSFKNDEQGVHANLQTSVTDLTQTQMLATASLVVEPGLPVDVRVCTRGQPCAAR